MLDRALAVCAVSEAAERLLAANEPDVVNRHVTDLLMPADAEERSGESLSVAVAWAARGEGGVRTDRGPAGQHVRDPPDRPDRQLRTASSGTPDSGIVRNLQVALRNLRLATPTALTAYR